MNYNESQPILDEVKKANKILLNCHRGPDSDSVGSALAMKHALLKLGKEVEILCPSDTPKALLFLPAADSIKKIDYETFDFTGWDLFISLDSSALGMITNHKDWKFPADLEICVIDHHYTNENYGKINLVDSGTTSTAEVLFNVFSDWEIEIDEKIANCLLTGIMGDTGVFQYQEVGAKTLEVAAELIKKGADKDNIIFHTVRSIPFEEVKAWSEIINVMQIEREYGFVWSAIKYKVYGNSIDSSSAKENASNLFFPIIKDTDFGVIMVENKEGMLSVSLRSRKDFDVSKIAQEIGGGGHKTAAGARVELPFDEAVQKVLEVCRKYASKVD